MAAPAWIGRVHKRGIPRGGLIFVSRRDTRKTMANPRYIRLVHPEEDRTGKAAARELDSAAAREEAWGETFSRAGLKDVGTGDGIERRANIPAPAGECEVYRKAWEKESIAWGEAKMVGGSKRGCGNGRGNSSTPRVGRTSKDLYFCRWRSAESFGVSSQNISIDPTDFSLGMKRRDQATGDKNESAADQKQTDVSNFDGNQQSSCRALTYTAQTTILMNGYPPLDTSHYLKGRLRKEPAKQLNFGHLF
ncbi:hypothetical protein R3P38DRAFT_2786905 [Favolaschia claudopus]|uniref:Uncharacterized protein n=1 Tax=Favolaschia claudopus TaxID=2862362 RepID=A0AAW0ARL1_9AGAR